MKFEQLKEGLFIKYLNERIVIRDTYVYGRVMFMNDEKVRVLTYDDFEQVEFRKNDVENMSIIEIYGTELMQYLVMRKDILTELLDEVRMNHAKEVVDINYDISKLDVCINDLKS
ncbi:MAG: hypothetical protein IPJ01_11235 [Micavibrio sp.]|nr:hypothetical protein [Micavibrio sp.]